MIKINIPEKASLSELTSMLREALPLSSANIFPLGSFWIIVLISLTTLLIFKFFFKKEKTKLTKKLAQIEFRNIEQDLNTAPIQKTILSISGLLRRVGVTVFGYDTIASLHSEAWASFIKEQDKKDSISFENAKLIASAPYRTTDYLADVDIKSLYKQSYEWSMEQL